MARRAPTARSSDPGINYEEAYHAMVQQYNELNSLYEQQQQVINQLLVNQANGQPITIRVDEGIQEPEITLQQVEVVDESPGPAAVANDTGVDQDQEVVGVQTRRSAKKGVKRKAGDHQYDQEQSAAIDSIAAYDIIYPEEDAGAANEIEGLNSAHRGKRNDHTQVVTVEVVDSLRNPRKIAPKRSNRKLVIRPDDVVKKEASIWICPFCEALITTKWYLREHLKSVHNSEHFVDVIKECKFESEQVQAIFGKLREEAGKDRWPCPGCPQYFTVKSGLKAHIKKFHPLLNVNLDMIQKIASNSDEAKRRNKELKRNIFLPLTALPEFIRSDTDFQCPVLQCIFRTHSKLGMITHYESVHLSVKYLCPCCTHMTGTCYDMRRHFERHHTAEVHFKAHLIECIAASDPRAQERLKEGQVKVNETTYSCPETSCKFTAKSRATTKRHHSKVHLQLRFLCPCCSEFHWTAAELRSHVTQFHTDYTGDVSETGVRPDSVEAKEHGEKFGLLPPPEAPISELPKQIHANNNVYECPILKCGFSTAVEKYLRAHYSKMHLRMRFLCPWCIEYFFASHELILHARKYHPGHPLTEETVVPVQEGSAEDQAHQNQFGVAESELDSDQVNNDSNKKKVRKGGIPKKRTGLKGQAEKSANN